MSGEFDFADAYTSCYNRMYAIVQTIPELETDPDPEHLGLIAADFSFCLFYHVVAIDGQFSEEEYDLSNAVLGDWQPFEKRKNMADHILQTKPNFLYDVPTLIARAARYDSAHGTSVAAELTATTEIATRIVQACDGEISDRESRLTTQFISRIRTFLTQAGVPANFDFANDASVLADLNGETKPAAADNQRSTQKDLTDLLGELDALVGLDELKRDVKSLVNQIHVAKMRQEKGLPVPLMTRHLVFTGNPGTGKTTVARMLAAIYRAMGLLSQGHLVETDRSGLVGGYVGQTALKVQEVVGKALGGVLFVDEAYSLVSGRTGGDYGLEAIDTLLKLMEDNRENLVVIVAGYEEKMSEFLLSNPGLKSRFNKFMHFPDYAPSELIQIFERLVTAGKYELTPEAQELSRSLLIAQYEMREKNFGNARLVRNFFERTIARQADRVATLADPNEGDLCRLEVVDLPAGERFN